MGVMASVRRYGAVALFVGFCMSGRGVAAPGDGEVTLASLLEEMVDRDRLSRLPDPAYVCRQASSFDRRAVDPGDVSTWYANMDRSWFVRTEENGGRTEHVLMDEAGPGAVVRCWATWHGPGGGPFSNGILRVYLDQATEPAIAGPIADIIGGSLLCGPPLSESVSPLTPPERRGNNLYLPIPYARHCKVTYQTPAPIDPGAHQGEALYYQINYRTYPADTRVATFDLDTLGGLEASLQRLQRRLLRSRPPSVDAPADDQISIPLNVTIPAQKAHEVVVPGPGAIRELVLRLDAEDPGQALRSTILEMQFDEERTVWCPAGDFFGTGTELAPHRTWYTRVHPDGRMRAFWVMPFASSCRVILHNTGAQPVTLLDSELRHTSRDWHPQSMHFHATWRQLTRVPTQTNTGADHGAFDVNYVRIDGRGIYVGDSLTLFNGTSGWWGEGDEKIYIDGEAFPSHFGTGTEDYYGYAWSNPNVFEAPFHAQPIGRGAQTPGLVVNSRYRALDAIPFTRSLQVDMELWHWQKTRVNFAPTTFWYARPGAHANVEPDPASAALPIARQKDDVVPVFRVAGALEGEALEIVETSGGTTSVQTGDGYGWSGHAQLWWRDPTTNDTLTLQVPAEQAGPHDITFYLTQAHDYGQVAFIVNGAVEGAPLDLYRESVDLTVHTLKAVPLNAGPNRLTLRIAGAHPQAEKRHMVGLDCLVLTPDSAPVIE